jgi:hypothetical protein
MPDETLQRRFEVVVQGTNEPMVRRYLEEAYRCFAAEAYNGTVVMTWNAVAYYLRQVVETISVVLFEYNYTILYDQNPPAELWRINDHLFLQTCRRMGVLCDVIDYLDRLRNRRNDCAHPSGIFVLPDETVELAESIRNVVSRQVTDECLTDMAILREFVQTASEQDGTTIACWVQDALCPKLAHDLLTIFSRNDEVKNISGIVGLWRELWDRLDDPIKQRLWDRIERTVQTMLQEGEEATLRTPEELVRFIVWPHPDDEHQSRDRIGQMLVEWLERLAQSGEFREVDMALARRLRQHMPAFLSERFHAVLQEMTRRYTE